jgi:hypothetical protein
MVGALSVFCGGLVVFDDLQAVDQVFRVVVCAKHGRHNGQASPVNAAHASGQQVPGPDGGGVAWVVGSGCFALKNGVPGL